MGFANPAAARITKFCTYSLKIGITYYYMCKIGFCLYTYTNIIYISVLKI